MPSEGILRAKDAIERRLKRAEGPVKAGELLREIKEEVDDVRDIELRGAVWVLIDRGRVTLTPERELILGSQAGPKPLAK